jgi:predicted lipoprotein with Yx(FWY)xxD motif
MDDMTIRTRITAVGAVAVLAAVPAVLTSGALAKTAPKPVLRAAKNSKLKTTVVVNTRGRTIYRLAPETPSHLLCTNATCLRAWPMVTVPAGTKPVAGPGISGKLGTIRRGNKLQVTLRGEPLYTFFMDRAAGQANGEGLIAFGGTWHAVTAKAGAATTSHAGSTAPSTGGGDSSGDAGW